MCEVFQVWQVRSGSSGVQLELSTEYQVLSTALFQNAVIQLLLAPIGGSLDESQHYRVRILFG
jgi:hypothetical protein